MTSTRVTRSVFVAAFFAALCVFTVLIGALVTLAAGTLALMLLSRDDASMKSGFAEFLPWVLCTTSFAVATLALAPFTQLSAVVVAFCVLSPLFGIMVYLVERLLSRPTSHAG